MCKLIRVLFIMLMLCSFGTAFAQLPLYDLESYTCPDTKWQMLEFQYDMSGSGEEYQNYADTTGVLNEKENVFMNDLQMEFRQSLVTRRMEQSLFVGVVNARNFMNSSEYDVPETAIDSLEDKQWRIGVTVSRKYYTAKNFFLEAGATVNTYDTFSQDHHINEILSYDLEGDIQSVLAYMPLKFGKGRIENVSSAQQAQFILQALIKQGRVRSDITEDDIVRLADHICRLNSERYFDDRIQRMEEIESLDSLLTELGVITKRDARYFTSLSDMWNYGNNVSRYAGNSAAFVIIPGFSGRSMEMVFNNGDPICLTESLPMLDAGLELKHSHPINLYWQNDMELNVFAGARSENTVLMDTIETIESDLNYRVMFSQDIMYVPDTRTDISLGYFINYARIVGSYDEDYNLLRKGGDILKCGLELDVNYYISPRFRLSFQADVSYNWLNSESYSDFDFGTTSYSFYNSYSSSRQEMDEISSSISLNLVYKLF